MEKKISSEEYQKSLKEYFKEVGPNPAVTMIGSMSWCKSKENEFKEKLKAKNVVVKD